MIILDRSFKVGLSFLFLLLFAGGAVAQADIIDFESERWGVQGSDTKVENYLGEKSLQGEPI